MMCAWSWNFCPILPFVIWLQIHFHSCLTLQWSPSQPISILRSTDGTQIIQVTKKKFPRLFFSFPLKSFPSSEFDSHLAIPPSPTVPASSGSTATSGTEAAKVKGRAKCNAKNRHFRFFTVFEKSRKVSHVFLFCHYEQNYFWTFVPKIGDGI